MRGEFVGNRTSWVLRITLTALLCSASSLGPGAYTSASEAATFLNTSITITTPPTNVGAPLGESREAARLAYVDTMLPALAVPNDWNGSAADCVPGSTSTAFQQATLTAINYARNLVHLPPVTISPGMSDLAQAAALMMVAEGRLSHTPVAPWKCISDAGIRGAGTSNLYLGRSGAQSIAGYLDDPFSNNLLVGHRRWILYSGLHEVGIGNTSNSNALAVISAGPMTSTASPEWVSWPPTGYAPWQVEPESRWSLSYPGGDFSHAVVTATTDSGSLAVTATPPVDGYGDNTLSWDMRGLEALQAAQQDTNVNVTVSGVVVDGISVSKSYTVRLFDAVHGPVAGAVVAKDAAGNGVDGVTALIQRGSCATPGASVWLNTTASSPSAIGGFGVSLSPDNYCVTVQAVPSSYRVPGPQDVTISADKRWITIWLARDPSYLEPVSGAVVAKDSAGDGINDVTALIQRGSCASPGASVWQNTTATSRWSAGGFGISLDPGAYCVTTQSVPATYSKPAPQNATLSIDARWITLWLPRDLTYAAPVNGAVAAKDAAGNGVNDVTVLIQQGACSLPGASVWQNKTTTGRWSSGAFGISLAPGPYCVTTLAVPGGYLTPAPQDTTISANTPWITIWLPQN